MMERICFIMLVNLVFYWRTLKFKYCSDDIPVYQHPPIYKNKWHKRFLQLIASCRIKPDEDHAITTVLNGLAAIFIYTGLGHNDISFLTAMLFSFCPANNQGSVWISGRWYAIVLILLMASATFPYFAPIFILMASVHPAGWFSPFGFIGSTHWYLAIIGIATMWYQMSVIRFMVDRKRKMEAVDEDKLIFTWNRLIVALKTYGFYAALIIIPFKLTFYHSFLHSMAGNDIMRKEAYKKNHFFYIGCGLAAFLVYSLWHWTPVAWGVAWYTITIAPYTNIYRCNQEVAERYAHIASVGLLFALSNLIIANPVLIAIFMAMFVTRLWVYMTAFQDDYWLIEYAVAEDPGAWYAWHTRALKRFDQGCVREALNMWVMAKMISPKEFKVILNIGVLLKMLKKDDEAEQFFKQAEENIVPGQEEMARGIIANARSGKNPICT